MKEAGRPFSYCRHAFCVPCDKPPRTRRAHMPSPRAKFYLRKGYSCIYGGDESSPPMIIFSTPAHAPACLRAAAFVSLESEFAQVLSMAATPLQRWKLSACTSFPALFIGCR